jgi:hypothetical protein
MKRVTFLFAVALLAMSSAIAQQNVNDDFTSFAKQQSQLFVAAYQQKDVTAYNRLLKDFLNRYETLTKEQQKQHESYYVNAFYNLSCTYSLLNNKKLAIQSLAKAVQGGYDDYNQIAKDSDLNNIRHEKDYKVLVQPLRETGDYLYILRKDNKFNKNDSIVLPAFTYQSAGDEELKKLRLYFKLDSIAGTGNEVSKMINVLHWVHNTIPHDGQHESGIKTVNGFDIAATAQAKQIGVSCGELATVLNDCYLALGFKSRKVYCFPKDSLNKDYDSHVINAVYSNEMKKWLWMDPTNDAYVMNEKGELLGVDEVRNRLINGQPLIINPDANWNRKESVKINNYLYNYMAKNLYRFYCAVENRLDAETRGGEKTIAYVNLVPVGYGKFRDLPAKRQWYNKDLHTTFVHYTTNNSTWFWQKP